MYAIWKTCERLRMTPPGIEPIWDDNNVWAVALMISYGQIRDIEEQEELAAMLGAKVT